MSSILPSITLKTPENPKRAPDQNRQRSDSADTLHVPKDSSDAPALIQDEKLNKKKDKLKFQIKELEDKIEQTQSQLDDVNGKLGDIDASARVQRHIKLLHQYNEIKDIGMGLFGMIAERRGVRVKDVFEEFGVSETD